MTTSLDQFRSSRKAKVERDRLLEISGTSGQSLDRLAIALSIAKVKEDKESLEDPQLAVCKTWPSMESEDGTLHQVEAIDDFDGHAVFLPVLEYLEGKPLNKNASERLRFHLNRGYDYLYRAYERSGSWPKTLATISPTPKRGGRQASGQKSAVSLDIQIGHRLDTSQPVYWRFNQEAGSQTNSNVRIVGMPGVGKSQLLLNLLASVAEQDPDVGFILFDYKGDLHTNADFIKTTGATVHHPGESPIPVNPFQLFPGVNPAIAPRAFVEVFSLIESKLGPIQKRLITEAMTRAYDGTAVIRGYPTLPEVVDAIETVYEEAERKPDSVIGILHDLTGYSCFADESAQSQQELLSCRWVINLAGLPTLREFVASVFLQFLHQATRALPDASFDHREQVRAVRTIIAIDEAHYYLKHRCQPLLDLIRSGRSKGVPVFLSSQSLEDFRKYTELNEFLPNTFCFKHGIAPDRKTLAGSLGLGTSEADQVANKIPTLDKFSGYATIARDPGEGHLSPLHLKGFWERTKTNKP